MAPSYQKRTTYVPFVLSYTRYNIVTKHHIPWIPLLKTYRNALLVLPIVVLSVAVLPVSTVTAPEFALRPFLMRYGMQRFRFILTTYPGLSWSTSLFRLPGTSTTSPGILPRPALLPQDSHITDVMLRVQLNGWFFLSFPFYANIFIPARDRATNGYPLKVEFPENIRGCVENWNIVTQTWLRNCTFYLNETPPFAYHAYRHLPANGRCGILNSPMYYCNLHHLRILACTCQPLYPNF